MSRLVPWDVAAARRWAMVLLLGSGGAQAFESLVFGDPYPFGARLLNWAVTALALALGVLLALIGRSLTGLAYLGVALFGTAGVAAVAMATQDATSAPALFLSVPLLFAVQQLRPAAAYLVIGATVAAYGAIVGTQLPASQFPDTFAYGSLAYVMLGILLSRGAASQRRLTALLEQQANVDTVTGLVTRRFMDESTRRAIADTDPDSGVALIVIDIDHFKTINDSHGHPIGDEALRHVAHTIRANTRADAVLGRLGGDELAVLLPGCSLESASRRAEQIVAAVAQTPLELADGRTVPLSISAGIAQVPDTAASQATLYAAADSSLYNAKENGRARVGRAVPIS
nr:GGDEF domain-containing protein [Kineosporia mesophila]